MAMRPQARGQPIQTENHSTRARSVDGAEVPYFLVASLDWAPRGKQDLDAGMRLRSQAQQAMPRPNPHVIGAMSGFLPQVDIWRVVGRTAPRDPGPLVQNAKGQGIEAAPGTDGYFPAWYHNLIKEY